MLKWGNWRPESVKKGFKGRFVNSLGRFGAVWIKYTNLAHCFTLGNDGVFAF